MDTKKKVPWYDKIEWFIIVVLFTCMTAITFFTVCTRYLFAYTLSWAEQMSRLMLVWISFAGMSWAGKINAHNRVTAVAVVFNKKPKVANALLTLGDLIAVAFGIYMACQTGSVLVMIYKSHQVLPSMQWCPKWVMYLPGVLGMIGFSLRILQRLYNQYFVQKKAVSLDAIREGSADE